LNERAAASTASWGKGNAQEAKKAMREAGRQKTGHASLPYVKMAPLSAPGPSGDRQEDLDAVVEFAGAGQRRRLFRALDTLTVRWATGDLPNTCRWLLNTQLLFLRKDREPECKQFDDEEWTQYCIAESLDDVPEGSVTTDPTEAADSSATSPKVRPIQMGEFLRKFVSKRLLSLADKSIATLMTAARQLGLGTTGGMEALAIFHQILYDEWAAGGLTVPLARIKVDEKNCFGRLEWRAIREASRDMLPRHTAVACWKHAAVSYVEHPGVALAPKDRGTEQGDVDGAWNAA
jgi:hypothetical protein